MSTTVDRDLLQLYVLGELDDARSAEVEKKVAEDPAWAEALQAEATLEVGLFEVVDEAPVPVVAPVAAEVPWWLRLWRQMRAPALGLALAAGAALMMFGGEEPLPSYQIEVRGGEAQVRSTAAAPATTTYTRGSSLALVLRPETRVLGSPQVQVLIDGAALRGVRLNHLEGGAVEIDGVFGEDLQEPTVGQHKVTVHIGEQVFEHTFIWRASGQ